MEASISNTWIYPMGKRRKKFLEDEIEEMKKDRWIESEKAQKDLGEDIYLLWIEKWAKQFRIAWEKKYGPVS